MGEMLNVTGVLSPDSTCNYVIVGYHNERIYARRADGAWFIWWNPPDQSWYLSEELGVYGPRGWASARAFIIDEYFVYGTATGIAFVNLGSH